MLPQFIIRHPREGMTESYNTEAKALIRAEDLVKSHGGYAQVYQRIALVDVKPVVTR